MLRALFLGAVLALVAAPSAALAATPLDAAPVPSLCEHPAGNLVDGKLPGIAEGDGVVELASPEFASGSLRGAPSRELAAVVRCNRGGVAWPDNIVIWDDTPAHNVVANFTLSDVTGGGREYVHRLAINGSSLIVDVSNITTSEDAACCGSKAARLTYKWDAAASNVKLQSTRTYRPQASAKTLIAAVKGNQRGRAGTVAKKPVINKLFALNRTHRLRLGACHGQLSDAFWVMSAKTNFLVGCELVAKPKRGDGETLYILYFDPADWNTWKAKAIQGVAG